MLNTTYHIRRITYNIPDRNWCESSIIELVKIVFFLPFNTGTVSEAKDNNISVI